MNSSGRAIVSLSWQSFAYGIGVVGSQLITYLTVPVLTRFMTRDEYGAVTVITALYAFLNTLTNAGLPPATFRYYNDSQDPEEKRLTLGTSQFMFFLFAAVPAVAIWLFGTPMSQWLLGTPRYALALEYAACFLIVDSLKFFGDIVLRIQVRPFASSLVNLVGIALEAGVALLLVMTFNMGAGGYWLGFFIGGIVALVLMMGLIRKTIVFRATLRRAGELLEFGIPLIPAALSLTALRLADRYVIGAMAGLGQVAVYDVGYKIGGLISVLFGPFRLAWLPYAFSVADKPDAAKTYRDILTYLTAGCAFLVVGAIAFRRELVGLMAPASYAAAAGVVAWVAIAQIFQAAYIVLSIGPMIKKRTRDLAWVAVASGVLNVILNFVLIPIMGILGAALATLIAYVLLGVLTYVVCQRVFPVPIDWRRMGMLLLAGAAIIGFIAAAESLPLGAWQMLLVKVVALMAFPALLLLVGFVRLSQLRHILETTRELIAKKSKPGKP